jgi:hypothetical protein
MDLEDVHRLSFLKDGKGLPAPEFCGQGVYQKAGNGTGTAWE